MSMETAFHHRLQAITDQWMDLFGYLAPSVVTRRVAEASHRLGIPRSTLYQKIKKFSIGLPRAP